MKFLIFWWAILCFNLVADDVVVLRYFEFSPQIKLGKLENGNGFSEIQYFKLRYDFNDQYTIQAGASTGFTSPRNRLLNYNHAINRIGYKFTFNPFKSNKVGFFFEGSYTDIIVGNTHYNSYFVYDTFQAVGVKIDIKQYDFSVNNLGLFKKIK